MSNIPMNEATLSHVLNIYMESFNKYFSVQELQIRELKLIYDEFNKKTRDIPQDILFNDNNYTYSNDNKMKKTKLTKEARKKSGYNLFISEYSKAHLQDKTRFADGCVAWKELNDSSRKIYNDQAKVANSLIFSLEMSPHMNVNSNLNSNLNMNTNMNSNYHQLSNPVLHDSLLRNSQLQQQQLMHNNQLQQHQQLMHNNQLQQQQLYQQQQQHHHLQHQQLHHHGIINNNMNMGNNMNMSNNIIMGNNMNLSNNMNMGSNMNLGNNIDDDSSYLKAALEKERRLKDHQVTGMPIPAHIINENRVERLPLKRGSAVVVDDEAERRRKKEKKGLQTFDSLGGDDF